MMEVCVALGTAIGFPRRLAAGCCSCAALSAPLNLNLAASVRLRIRKTGIYPSQLLQPATP